jgi:hypothetical protein
MCHGWAPAALNFQEPHAIILKGPSGISVPFGSSDIKALLSLHSGEYATSRQRFMAGRCNEDLRSNPSAANNPECKDVNAGAFHLVLTNLIGRKKEGFVADVTRDLEVWNQPVSGFKTTIKGERMGRSEGANMTTVKEVEVETVMNFGKEISPQWNSYGAYMSSKTYRYRLELNALGQIVGGEWIESERPDFLWQLEKPEFIPANRGGSSATIEWNYLDQIYQAAIEATEDAVQP